MKRAQTNQTDGQEAPDSSSRPAKFTIRAARKAARRLHGGFIFKQGAAQDIARALHAFGGRAIAVETQTRATARS